MPEHLSTVWHIHYKDKTNAMYDSVYVEAETAMQAIEKLEKLYPQKPQFQYLNLQRLTIIK